jgi:hypothetical protein
MYKKRKKQYRNMRGSSLVEAMGAICLLFMIFFAILQIHRWCMTRFFCQYAAFYGAKGMALGYKTNISLRGARTAAVSISGERTGVGSDDESTLMQYMSYGDASGVSYRYWHPQRRTDPHLRVGGTVSPGATVDCGVSVVNMPLLTPSLAVVFGITDNPVPGAEVKCINYSDFYLED